MSKNLTHLFLEVRPHTQMPYCVVGDLQEEIARLHATPVEAESAIHEFCRLHHQPAIVRIYTPRGRIWREDEIDQDGHVVSTLPLWRVSAFRHDAAA